MYAFVLFCFVVVLSGFVAVVMSWWFWVLIVSLLCLWFCCSLSLFISLCLSLSLSVCLSVCLPVCLCLSLSLYLSCAFHRTSANPSIFVCFLGVKTGVCCADSFSCSFPSFLLFVIFRGGLGFGFWVVWVSFLAESPFSCLGATESAILNRAIQIVRFQGRCRHW